jgi:hypothetical protein
VCGGVGLVEAIGAQVGQSFSAPTGSSRHQIGGVVEFGGDLEQSAEGFDVGAEERDGDGVEVAAFDVGDTRSGDAMASATLRCVRDRFRRT